MGKKLENLGQFCGSLNKYFMALFSKVWVKLI